MGFKIFDFIKMFHELSSSLKCKVKNSYHAHFAILILIYYYLYSTRKIIIPKTEYTFRLFREWTMRISEF